MLFIMWLRMFTAAAVRVIYWKWNHQTRYLPFICLSCRAYANSICTKAYNFFWYRVLTVKISVTSISSSRSHWKILLCGGFCFVRPILIQYGASNNEFSLSFMNPQMNPGPSVSEGARMSQSSRRHWLFGVFFLQMWKMKGKPVMYSLTCQRVKPRMQRFWEVNSFFVLGQWVKVEKDGAREGREERVERVEVFWSIFLWLCFQLLQGLGWGYNGVSSGIGVILIYPILQQHPIQKQMQTQPKQQTDRSHPKPKPPKPIPESLYSPDSGYDKFLEKPLEVDFLINQERERNDVILKIMTGRERELVRIQLMSESDLFFYYELVVGNGDLGDINGRFGLEVRDMAEFALMLEKNIGEADRGEKELFFQVKNSQNIELVLTKQINHKNFLVLTLTLTKLPYPQATEIAAYRYGSLRQEIADFELKIKQIKEVVRAKNPYLLTFINKI